MFDGWRLSMWESGSLYHYVYGLNPMGPHRPFADSLFAGMRGRCVRCSGRRMLTLDDETWCECPACEGTRSLGTARLTRSMPSAAGRR